MKRVAIIFLSVLFFTDIAQAASFNFSGTITSASLEWWGIENGSSFTGQITYTPVTGPPADVDVASGYAAYYTNDISWSIYAGGYYFDFGMGTLNQVSFLDNKTPYGSAATGDSMSIEKYSLYPSTDSPIYSNISAAGGYLDSPLHPSLLWFSGSEQLLPFFDSFPDPIDFSQFTIGEFCTGLDHAGTIESETFSQLAGRIESVSVPEPSCTGVLIGFLLPMFFFAAYHRK